MQTAFDVVALTVQTKDAQYDRKGTGVSLWANVTKSSAGSIISKNKNKRDIVSSYWVGSPWWWGLETTAGITRRLMAILVQEIQTQTKRILKCCLVLSLFSLGMARQPDTMGVLEMVLKFQILLWSFRMLLFWNSPYPNCIPGQATMWICE